MPCSVAQRTIVKSKPEIWEEISDVTSLARHLGEFGEIAITRITADTAVAWEGDRVRGTVTLERSGWGTKVTITAEAADDVAAPEAPADVTELGGPSSRSELEGPSLPQAGGPTDVTEATEEPPAPRLRWWQRLFGRRTVTGDALPAPEPSGTIEPERVPETEPEPAPAETTACVPAPEPTAAAQPEPAPQTELVLTTMLDRLGAAHHRPFSRG